MEGLLSISRRCWWIAVLGAQRRSGDRSGGRSLLWLDAAGRYGTAKLQPGPLVRACPGLERVVHNPVA